MGILDNMKQAKDMYSNMKKAQQEIEKIEDESIKNGNHQNMEKLIIAACNDAMVKVEKEIKRKVGSMMNLPSGFKLPF
jgi:DNA-binding protein YbaB